MKAKFNATRGAGAAGYNHDRFVEGRVEVVFYGFCPADEVPPGLIARFFLHQDDYRV